VLDNFDDKAAIFLGPLSSHTLRSLAISWFFSVCLIQIRIRLISLFFTSCQPSMYQQSRLPPACTVLGCQTPLCELIQKLCAIDSLMFGLTSILV
jgi:hypothetical protein